MIFPGEGRKVCGFSALTRHSMACPMMAISSCFAGRSPPAAMRICSSTRSMSVMHLGDGMLDLDAGVHLDEIEVAVLKEKFDGADAEIFHVPHRLGAGLADPGARGGGREPARGLLPRPSGGGAAASSRARRDGSRRRGRRRAPGSRCGAASAGIFRDRPRRRRTPTWPRWRRSTAPCIRSSAVCATFMPRPPPPAAAFTSTGKPIALCDRQRVVVGARRRRRSRAPPECRAAWRSSWPRSCRPSGGCARPSGR